jgi:hypothetical protein
MPAAHSPPRRDSDPLDAILRSLAPCGAFALDAYEACVRAAEDLQRAAARRVRFPPAKDALTSSAALTRDLGALQASWARWVLDL